MTDMADSIRADREAGTPGPWEADIFMEEVTSADRDICLIVGKSYGYEYFPHEKLNDTNWTGCERNISDTRRIARLPDLEEAYLDLLSENARIRERVKAADELALSVSEYTEAMKLPCAHICCDGQMCGCYGATNHQFAEYIMAEALTAYRATQKDERDG